VTHCEITPGLGDVALTGTRVLTQTEATTYTLKALGPEGRTITQAVDVPPDPQISYFNASRTTVEVGEEITLGWLTSCADTVTIDQGVGEVGANGSRTVTPAQLPIMFTLTAANEKGSVSETVLIEPNSPPRPPAPSVTFSAGPRVLKHVGESATLTWSTENATSCTIDSGVGPVGLNGNLSVTPDRPTTYRLTAVGPGGETTRTATITFVVPTVSITADEFIIAGGESTTLHWVLGNADSAVITPGIGVVHPGESATVSPGSTTTYTITATGPGGRATASVTVRVLGISIYNPSDNETVLEQPVRVIGHVTEPLAAVTVNGVSAAVTSAGDFEVQGIPLALGPNVITASAQRNGKSVSRTITVTYESFSVAITSPGNGAIVHASHITVLGTVNSPGAQVTVNGIPAQVDWYGAFTAEGISLIEGENTIVATAQQYDLTATAQITVTLSSVQTCVVPGEYSTIQAALDASQPNQVIMVCPGTYRESVDFPSHSVTLVGRDGPEATIIEGNLSQSVVSMGGSQHTLRGFTITNGRIGIYCVGYGEKALIEDCVITRNSTTSNGGGIYSDGYMGSPSLILRRCIISENQAASGAGVYLTFWVSATFDRCTIARNHATSEGGGIFTSGSSCVLTNSLIYGNRAEFIGGAFNASSQGNLTLTNCTISGNTSDYWCNGIYSSSSCNTVITNTIIWDESSIDDGIG
jgi:predicted outer membrane repeat protein